MDIIPAAQVLENRQALENMSDTFGVPVLIQKTTYANAAFEQAPDLSQVEVKAIKDFMSKEGTKDMFRNALGPTEAHEQDLYIFWDQLVDAGLIESGTNRVLLDHNCLVTMEGQVYQIEAFSGVGYMTKIPSFLQMRIKRRWSDKNGASSP